MDINVEKRMELLKYDHKSDYIAKRYVDNYYVFSNDKALIKRFEQELEIGLSEYKMSLNELKTDESRRPFYSGKSLLIDQSNREIQFLWKKLFASHDFTSKLQPGITTAQTKTLISQYSLETIILYLETSPVQ